MQQPTADRLHVKHPENSLYHRLAQQLGLAPAVANSAVEIFLDWASTTYDSCRPPGQITHTVVAKDEPAGKPIKYCHTIEVWLTLNHRNDIVIQNRHGTCALRRLKVLRLCWEAYEQGGLLSYEDLCAVLGVDISSIKRFVNALREDGLLVPTRGLLKDMGRAPSHKEQIGSLLCRGYTYTEITAITGHDEGSIERYALALGRIIALCDHGAQPNDIRIICELSSETVETYLRLYREHNTDTYRPHLETLKRRFECGKQSPATAHKGLCQPKVDPAKHLKEQTLHTAVSRLLQQDLALTTAVADFISGKVCQLAEATFAEKERLAPGQTIMLVDTAASAPKFSGQKTPNRPKVPVVLSPWTDDKRQIWASSRSNSEKRALIADALVREAVEQGGAVSIPMIAALLYVADSTLGSDLQALNKEQQDPTPIKGITEDAGPTLTHKEVICQMHDAGKTPPEISRATKHSRKSRDRYLKTELRLETLIRVIRQVPDALRVARFLGIQKSVAIQYLKLLESRPAAAAAPAAPSPSAQGPPLASAAPPGHAAHG